MRRGRLARALEALRAVHAGADPDLSAAPTLELWSVAEIDDCVVLVGVVFGHPEIADGRLAATSPLLALADEEGWARTVSRFYRLGRRFGGPRDVH